MAELPEHLPLGELKKKIKEFKTKETPKLSSKKGVLAEYARKVGILRGDGLKAAKTVSKDITMNDKSSSDSQDADEDEEPVATAPKPKAKKMTTISVTAPTAPKTQKKVPMELPEVLKAYKVLKTVPTTNNSVIEKAAPKGSPFSAFMAANKGKGLSMSQLAQLYKRQK